MSVEAKQNFSSFAGLGSLSRFCEPANRRTVDILSECISKNSRYCFFLFLKKETNSNKTGPTSQRAIKNKMLPIGNL
jgi:hypothetical protein